MEEIWEQSSLAPEYEVSNWGRLRWTDSKRWASIFMINGYQATNRSIKYTDNATQDKIFIHRLVAYEFVEGYKENYVVNHIDGCKTNNFAYNLEWVDRSVNITDCYNPQKVYTQDIIDNIYADYRAGIKQKELGIKYNINQAYISQLLYNNLSSKDIEPIRLLYNNKLYSIEELSSIYKVDKKIIEKII